MNAEFPNNKVIFSNLLVRADHGEEGRDNIRKVNELVESLNLDHISHPNITDRHLNGSKLHLNLDGSKTFAKNLMDVIRNIAN